MPKEIPASAEDAFLPEGDRLLSVLVGGVLASCHFFTPEEIEFDIDRRGGEQVQLEALLGFMQCLATSVGGMPFSARKTVRRSWASACLQMGQSSIGCSAGGKMGDRWLPLPSLY